MISRQAELWLRIQDMIGNASGWPKSIRRLFWAKVCWNNFQRVRVVSFCFVNGLQQYHLLQWCELRGLLRDRKAINHVSYLFDAFGQGKYAYIYAWDLTLGHDTFINGTIRKV